MELIRFRDVAWTYAGGRSRALSGLTLLVEKGEYLAIVGGTGAGKSTLCRLICGFVPHFFPGRLTGLCQVKAKDVRDRTLVRALQTAGFVFQNPANQMSGIRVTVQGEIAFGLENRGVPREAMIERVERVMDEMGITGLSDRHPATLSGGELQKVAMASILVMDPEILVLDEPCARLDPASSKRIHGLVQGLKTRGITIIVSQPAMDPGILAADRVLLLSEGRPAALGPPGKVLEEILQDSHGVALPLFHEAALRAARLNLWRRDMVLPASLDQAILGFKAIAQRSGS